MGKDVLVNRRSSRKAWYHPGSLILNTSKKRSMRHSFKDNKAVRRARDQSQHLRTTEVVRIHEEVVGRRGTGRTLVDKLGIRNDSTNDLTPCPSFMLK